MTRIQRLEGEIREFTRGELALFREWFQEYDSGEWDRQVEADALGGKFDKMAEKALAEHVAGKTTEL